MAKKLCFILAVILVFILSILYGIRLSKGEGEDMKIGSKVIKYGNETDREEPDRLETAKEVSSKEEKVGTNTEVILRTNYSLCGHTEQEQADKSYVVNLTKDELLDVYPDWRIITFSEDDVELEKDVDGICGEHYLVTEENGLIVVYKRKIDTENGQIGKEEYMTTDISVEYLPEEDLNNLIEGEEIYSREALNKFLEDYE